MNPGDKVLLDDPATPNYIPCIVTAEARVDGEFYYALEIDPEFITPTFMYTSIHHSLIAPHKPVLCELCQRNVYQFTTQVLLKPGGVTQRICNDCYTKKYGAL